MSQNDRVQRWRQRMRELGKEAITVWLDTQAKRRLEALAHTGCCSPSDIVQQALATYHPGVPQGLVSPDREAVEVSERLEPIVQRLVNGEGAAVRADIM